MPRRQKPGIGRKSVKKTTEDTFFSLAVEHLTLAKKIREAGLKSGGMHRTVMVRLNDVDVQMVVDSGANVNIMDLHHFKAFVDRTSDKLTLEISEIKLRTLQHKLDVKLGRIRGSYP